MASVWKGAGALLLVFGFPMALGAFWYTAMSLITEWFLKHYPVPATRSCRFCGKMVYLGAYHRAAGTLCRVCNERYMAAGSWLH